MSKRKEKISAFLDNDIHRDELMSFSLSAEQEDAKVVQRYQMIGDSLRGEVSDSSFVDVSAAVREALANENIADQVAVAPGTSKSEPATEKTGLFDLSGWFKPLAGMAVAASVAVVMVVTVTQQEGPAIAPVATNITAQPEVQLAVESNTPLQTTVENKDTDLNPYINQHLEFATQDSLQGRMPYVRAVSFEQKK